MFRHFKTESRLKTMGVVGIAALRRQRPEVRILLGAPFSTAPNYSVFGYVFGYRTHPPQNLRLLKAGIATALPIAKLTRSTAAFQCADTCQKPRFPACFTHKKLEQCGNMGYQFTRRSTLYLKEVNMNNQAQKRRSRDAVWPLRNAEGLTFAEAKRRKGLENARSIYTKA